MGLISCFGLLKMAGRFDLFMFKLGVFTIFSSIFFVDGLTNANILLAFSKFGEK